MDEAFLISEIKTIVETGLGATDVDGLLSDVLDLIDEKNKKIDSLSNNLVANTVKPLPYSLSQYGSGTQVLYRCAKCGTDFRILGNQEAFCHGCGHKQDWADSPRYCSEAFKEKYNDLVYTKYAFFNGKREMDEELRQLFYQFYNGEFR